MSDTPQKKSGCLARLLRVGMFLALAISILLLSAFFILNESRPKGTPGPEAEALAQSMLQAVNDKAWDETGAVEWTFARGHKHLWDRRRGLARVAWDDTVVHMRLNDRSGSAKRVGQDLRGDDLKKALEAAWKMWANDSFWLNPISKVDDPGTTRSVVTLPDGSKGLLIEYSSGGVTPGDAYLWILGKDNLPKAWKMWVNIIPIGGIHTTWEGWTTLDTGARVAPKHDLGITVLELKDIRGAKTLKELIPGKDPFASLAPSPVPPQAGAATKPAP